MKKAQVKLSTFCAEYDIPRTTVLDLVHREDFPAYKIAKRWYIDLPKFLKWREINCHK